MPGPVERWLETFMCKQYADTFEAYGFKTLQSVCQLQQPQLHAMGVAQEHVDKILESVHVLRQSMFGGMNHFKEGFTGQPNSRMQTSGYMQHQQEHMGNMNSNYMPQGNYNNSSHGNVITAHRGHIMDNMYQQHSQQQQQYFNNQGQYPMGQYNQQNSSYGPMMAYNNQQRMQNHQNAPASHLHSRQQNPQEVANNILQMAASYQPSQTVQVPLNSKHRSAPYHVPVSNHYNVQNHTEQTNRQFTYPNASPHHNQHGSRTSPVSPGSMYMHSPASQHSCQSLPNSSPRSIHSPPVCGNLRSPVPSPAGSMRSPCHMQSPVNTPINQQLHVSTGQQMVQSPPHQHLGYSPKNNPISPPTIHSPQYKQQQNVNQHGGQKPSVNDNIGSNNFTANSPLQSLQKLCMLPDHQVIDPKSIVNEASESPLQNQKNLNSDVDSNNSSTPSIETASVIKSTENKQDCSLAEICEAEQKPTKVDDYADDYVKMSEDNNIRKEIDPEKQKQKYLGQEIEPGLKREQPTSHCVQNSEKFDDSNQNLLQKSDKCDHQNQESTANEYSCQKENAQKPENSKIEAESGNISEKIENVTVENKIEPKNSGKDTGQKDDIEKVQVIGHEKLENGLEDENCCDLSNLEEGLKKGDNSSQEICDKSLGCENTHCDDQAKTDVDCSEKGTKFNTEVDCSEENTNRIPDIECAKDEVKGISDVDCRKDEVKSIVNGIDDSDEMCSSSEISRRELITSQKRESEIVDNLHDQKVMKKKLKNRVADKRALREIPARMASSSPYYVDDSSDEDSILMVRKDVKYTYSRLNKISHEQPHVSVSDNDIVVSDESLDRNSLDSDMSKSLGCDTVPTKSRIGYNPGHKKKNTNTKSATKKDSSSTSDNPTKEISTTQQAGTGRSKRTRTATSKYGHEMYLGDDFVLDSEEENKVEKMSKRKRKVSGDLKPSIKAQPDEIVIDSDEEIFMKVSVKKPDLKEINPLSRVGTEDVTEDSEGEKNVQHKRRKRKVSDPIGSNSTVKVENEDSIIDPTDSRDICIVDIIDSSDTLGDGSDIISFKYGPGTATQNNATPSTSKSEPLKKVSKTKSKPKVSKGGKSKSRGKILDESFKNMKLKKTMNLMKKKGKKKAEVPVKETGPFLRVKDSGTPKERCLVVNQQLEELSDKNSKSRKSAVQVSTVHVSKLPSEKSVHVPSAVIGDSTTWVCALCKKHSSYKFLGDLFGPYYVEGNLPGEDSAKTADKKAKQKRQSLNTSVQTKTSKSSRRKSKDSVPTEVWVHEDCATWSDGVLLIGAKIYGLHEATEIAATTVCTCCKETGAMVGCLNKGCSQKFHIVCAVETGCYLDEENYSLLCPKHRDKRLKSVETQSFKT